MRRRRSDDSRTDAVADADPVADPDTDAVANTDPVVVAVADASGG
jgi:hypothetical protein